MTGDGLAAQLTRHGLDAIEEARKRALGDLVLREISGGPVEALWVPGRIEVFGRHTDYGGGHSLIAPVPRGFVFVGRRRGDGLVSMTDAVRGERFEIDLAAAPSALEPSPPPAGWRRYAATAVHRLRRNFPSALAGADIVFGSDLPPSSGMSSSSALIVGLAAMLVRVSNLEAHQDWRDAIAGPADQAGYYACIENGMSFRGLAGDAGVGTHGGSEDHVAIVCGRAGYVSAWRFVPIRHVADVAIPDGWMFVIASSGVAAKKTGGARDAYNRLSRLARTLLDLWNGSEPQAPSLQMALASDAGAAERLRGLIRRRPADPAAADLEQRLAHFVDEDARITEAVAAFRDADRHRIGTLSDRSQADAERLLRNQVPETIALAHSARTLGAFGAASFGAGFGGSVWALVDAAEAEDFAARWLDAYRAHFPRREAATVFLAPPGPPLTWVSGSES